MQFFNRPKPNTISELNAIDDVLELSTKHNLEHHAEKAADKADKMLDKAVEEEVERTEEFKDAATSLELSTARRKNKEGLVSSVASVLRNLRK